MGNWFKTAILLGVMTALIVFIGNLLGGRQGMIIAFIIAMGMNFFSYWYSDRIVLRMYRAREVSPDQSPEIYGLVADIAQRAGLPMPRIYIIPEDSPNAFATGRNPEHAVVAVTQGLIKLMSREEIRGVISHEMAHIKNRDILIGSIAATMAGAVMILANMAQWTAFFGGRSDDEEGGGLGAIGMIIMAIVAPVAAMLVQMAISRSREYHADATGASFAGQSQGLANALEKLGAYSKRIPMHSSPQTSHMFIINPLSAGGIMNLFSTHPPLEERIARLRGIYPGRTTPDQRPDSDRGLKDAESFWNNLR
ncbi:Protease HtpX homolog [uncultured Desulfobacterium sp.]|uniref:Protease HtpX homolog n=1 Tax=uncultured Desulfobacterium sp. TaxID=201089 RepID=A0A445MX25_9BACT|nr:Protease HtpX homolog [uncultured Desulfobacterium sp.]